VIPSLASLRSRSPKPSAPDLSAAFALPRRPVSKIPGINHLRAVAALEKAGFRILRQGAHIVMTDGSRILTIPRHNPVNAFTMGGIVRDSGLSVEEFRKLL
jgi:hypothetical protein